MLLVNWLLPAIKLSETNQRGSEDTFSKNGSLIWNNIRAQLQGSAHPSTPWNTDEWRRARTKKPNKNQPIRSQSARPKEQERLKKINMERQTKCYWAPPWDAPPPCVGCHCRDSPLSRGLPTAPPLSPQRGAGSEAAARVWSFCNP